MEVCAATHEEAAAAGYRGLRHHLISSGPDDSINIEVVHGTAIRFVDLRTLDGRLMRLDVQAGARYGGVQTITAGSG
jgi:hypothetical protein